MNKTYILAFNQQEARSFVKKNPKDVSDLTPYLDKMYKLVNGSGKFERWLDYKQNSVGDVAGKRWLDYAINNRKRWLDQESS